MIENAVCFFSSLSSDLHGVLPCEEVFLFRQGNITFVNFSYSEDCTSSVLTHSAGKKKKKESYLCTEVTRAVVCFKAT